MSHRTTRTAQVTPNYGMRPVGGFGIRGWRVFCPKCGFLSMLYTHIRSADACRARHPCRVDEEAA